MLVSFRACRRGSDPAKRRRLISLCPFRHEKRKAGVRTPLSLGHPCNSTLSTRLLCSWCNALIVLQRRDFREGLVDETHELRGTDIQVSLQLLCALMNEHVAFVFADPLSCLLSGVGTADEHGSAVDR